MKLPDVWNERLPGPIDTALRPEAARLFRVHALPTDAAQWAAHRARLRERIWESLGIRYEPGLDLDCRETGSTRLDGYSVRNLFFRSRDDFYVTGNLYVPDGPGPFPGVLNLHGHWAQGRLAERVQSRGHTLARNGYVCLSIDAFGAGERALAHGAYEYHGEMLGASLFNLGESLMGIELVDNLRAVELLGSFDFVCPDRLGATGASGGGSQTLWLAAMDDRVKASVPVAAAGTFEAHIGGSNCVCETLPDGLTFMEQSALLALAAPNAVKLCNCLGEIYHAFFPREALRSVREARKVFQALGADGKLACQLFNQPHGYWPEMREAMLGWFDLHLRNEGHGEPKAEKPFRCLPEEALMVFPRGRRDPRVVSIAEYCRRRGRALEAQRKAETVTQHAARKEKIAALARVLKLGPPLKRKQLHRYPDDGSGWQRLAVETACGRLLPLLLRPPAQGARLLLLAGPVGKEALSQTSLFREALAAGEGLAIFDLWGTGEAGEIDASCGSLHHNLSRSCLWLGKTVLGEWVRDYALALETVREERGECVTLGGHKEAGLAALFCAIFSEDRPPAALEESPRSLLFHQEKPRTEPRQSFYSMALHLPGLLKWGDLCLAASLAGEVRWISPRRSDGSPWTEELSQTA